MTMLVKRNMTWVSDSAKLRMGFCRCSGTRVRAMAKMIAKTATCRIWFSATDLTIFSGKMWRMKSVQRSGVVSGNGLSGGAGGNDQAFAGFGEIDGEDAEEKSDGGDGFEVDETFPADAADFAEVAVTGDAGDQRAEDERRDDDFDEAEENVAEESRVGGEGGSVEAEFETGEHGEENPEGERAFLRRPAIARTRRPRQRNGDREICERERECRSRQPAAKRASPAVEQEFELALKRLWHAWASRSAE